MAKISELSDGGSLLPTDYLIAVRSGGNVKVQADTINVDQIDLGDNEKIRLGNSQDLQIYHDGTKSVIADTGTGQLSIQGENTIVLEETDGTNYATFTKEDAVTLYYAGSAKIATTSTGIDVTGSVTLPAGTEMVMPGDNVSVEVELIQPIAMDEGLRFAVREGGRTVGAGVVGKIFE